MVKLKENAKIMVPQLVRCLYKPKTADQNFVGWEVNTCSL
jgi:hypothetical protein